MCRHNYNFSSSHCCLGHLGQRHFLLLLLVLLVLPVLPVLLLQLK